LYGVMFGLIFGYIRSIMLWQINIKMFL
jgi:hypothetical protein